MITVAICDSEEKNRAELLWGCAKAQERLHLPICCRSFSTGQALLDGLTPAVDIILMNTRLADMNGLETARELRKLNTAVALIFVTEHLTDAVGAFEVQAADFIPRPMDIQRFGWSLTTVLQRLERERGDYVTFHTSPARWVRIPMHSILYVESGRNKAILHTVRDTYELYASMKDVEESLDPERFFRCHSGYIVNLSNIVQVNALDAMLIDGTMVSISKARRHDFMERLKQVSGLVLV